jgi:hypothetical protein
MTHEILIAAHRMALFQRHRRQQAGLICQRDRGRQAWFD